MSDESERRWHVDKRIPVPTIVAIVVQGALLAFAGGQLYALVGENSRRIATLERFAEKTAENRYTDKDASRDRLLTDLKVEELRRSIERLEKERRSASNKLPADQ